MVLIIFMELKKNSFIKPEEMWLMRESYPRQRIINDGKNSSVRK